MKLTTDDFIRHDACPRLETWSRRYDLPRIPLSEALRLSLRSGLLDGTPSQAYFRFVSYASDPGLDMEGRSVYDIAVNHAAMLEVIATYLIDGDASNTGWKPAPVVPLAGGTFRPQSFVLPDGRLRRVVLCSSWNALREQEERNSWLTVADCAMTDRPMLVNVIIIGQTRDGFRVSPWTTGYEHPRNGTLRIRRREGKFEDSWHRVRRENTECKPANWLFQMQQDGAFEDIVLSLTVDPSQEQRAEARREMERMASEISLSQETMRRSACFRYLPCPMAGVCHSISPVTPVQAGWREKHSPCDVSVVS